MAAGSGLATRLSWAWLHESYVDKMKQVTIFKSLSHNIFENLAFEDWIFKNFNFDTAKVLFLWRNTSCVVIGRHQNPWLEANTDELRRDKVPVARRQSGGGAVYHDLGNVNFTFFDCRDNYKRRRNLEWVVSLLWKQWGLPLEINKRDDILYKGHKVSGSAARLTSSASFHHFTLLLNTDIEQLQRYLRRKQLNLTQKSATPSVATSVANLASSVDGLQFDSLCTAVAMTMWQEHQVPLQDQKLYVVDPSCGHAHPGVGETRTQLQSWEWVYGKTPDFTITDSVSLARPKAQANIKLYIVKGHIADCQLGVEPKLSWQPYTSKVQDALLGVRFWPSDIHSALQHDPGRDHTSPHNPLTSLCEWIEGLP